MRTVPRSNGDPIESLLADVPGYSGRSVSDADILGLLDVPASSGACGTFGPCDTVRGAVRAVERAYNPLSIDQGREYNGVIYRHVGDEAYYSTPGVQGNPHSGPNPYLAAQRNGYLPADAEVVGYWHTHGAADPGYLTEIFSPNDVEIGIRGPRFYGVPGTVEGGVFVGTPGGRLLEWVPTDGDTWRGNGWRKVQTTDIGW